MVKWFLLGMAYVTGAFLFYIFTSIFDNDDCKEDIACISIFWPFAMVILIPLGLIKLFETIGDLIVNQIKYTIHRENKK